MGEHERTSKANKNIVYSFIIKGISIASQLALVPLTLHYLEKERYGIWLTLASLMGWFSFFDIGVGNGLRNKLSEALANKDLHLARTYVSTSYALVGSIFLSVMVLFWIVNPYLNWAKILNASPGLAVELTKMALFVFSFFCCQFILSLISNILYAYQEPALNNLINPLGGILSLLLIYILTLTTKGSLFLVSVILSAVPLLVLLIFNLVLLGGRFRSIAPNFRYVHFAHSRKLFGLGIQFFIIQIAFIVVFSSSNMILTQLFGPGEVTIYNIAYRYFTIGLMINGIITATYWSAFTDAYVRKEYDWIRNTIRRLENATFLLMGAILVSFILANKLFYWWLGGSVKIPFSIQAIMCLYSIISLFAAPQHIFLNGSGKIRLQLYTAVGSIIITVPMALLFCRTLHFGPAGVIMAMICTTLPVTILYKIQYAKIINGTAKGVWNQ